MYSLVRVDNQFRFIEGNPAGRMLEAQDVQALCLGQDSRRVWEPCDPLEKRHWMNFVRTGRAGLKEVRSTILESWKRCRTGNVEPASAKCENFITGRELERRKGLLYEISEPIMETLHQCVRGSGSLIVLVDCDAYILANLGDLASLREAEKLNFGPGANWSEFSVGTNAIGTAMTAGVPVHVTGAEHYCESHQPWTCAATPIRDPAGRIIGCLNISGPRENAHFHTLGMAVAAVRAIEERLRLEQSHQYYLNVSKHLSTVLNSVSEGLITVDDAGTITGMNVSAARLLRLHSQDLVGKPMGEVMVVDEKLERFLQAGKEYSEEELLFKSRKGTVRCIGSANAICGENRSRRGAVFTFSPTKRAALPGGRGHTANPGFQFKDIIGESPAMRETLEKAQRSAMGPSTVLITGESGTGKELFAQAIHNASSRKHMPFVSVNCGAMPSELIQSELFGYVEGAFTGARKGGRAGKFEQANGGAIFLDEIGEMPLAMQVNLLRVLEEKAIVRVGDSKSIPVDVRVLAATHKNLYDEVEEGNFREDLFYRLSVITLVLPSLRERMGDIGLLARHYVEKLSPKVGKQVKSVHPLALAAMEAHHWPGNVRELSNAVEYAINMLQGEDLLLEHLPPYLRAQPAKSRSSKKATVIPLHAAEKEAIEKALILLEGNITKVAGALGIGRNTLYDKLRKYSIRS